MSEKNNSDKDQISLKSRIMGRRIHYSCRDIKRCVEECSDKDGKERLSAMGEYLIHRMSLGLNERLEKGVLDEGFKALKSVAKNGGDLISCGGLLDIAGSCPKEVSDLIVTQLNAMPRYYGKDKGKFELRKFAALMNAVVSKYPDCQQKIVISLSRARDRGCISDSGWTKILEVRCREYVEKRCKRREEMRGGVLSAKRSRCAERVDKALGVGDFFTEMEVPKVVKTAEKKLSLRLSSKKERNG